MPDLVVGVAYRLDEWLFCRWLLCEAEALPGGVILVAMGGAQRVQMYGVDGVSEVE